ncbi:MAG TPA: cysteine desulfurase [Verrucomicrobiota bacterium]|nr:cysteine desulfurase [Verrucomicrobiota bacterium]
MSSVMVHAQGAPSGVQEGAWLDVAALRADFPILDQRVNGWPLVYLDNAATTQKPESVLAALAGFYRADNANVHRGAHTLSQRATDAYEGARERVARFLNARSAEEVVFTRGTTEAINLVAQTWGLSRLQTGDVILLTEMEHHSNLVPWQLVAERTGARLVYLPVTGDDGALDEVHLGWLEDPRVRLFAFTHVSNTLGVINPAADWCARARRRGIVTVVDAAQSAGHLPVDVQSIGCDFLAFSGHKLCGPTGIGALYGRGELLEALPPWQGGGDMISHVEFESSEWNVIPQKFEAGTPHIAGAVGLHAALDYVDRIGRDRIARHDRALAEHACEALGRLAGIRLLGPATGRSGVVSFLFPDLHAHDLVTFLDQRGVALRGGHHCNQPLMRKLGVTSTARASFYFYNTPAEIQRLVDGVREARRFFAG